MTTFVYNPDADYIFNAVINEATYSPQRLFDGFVQPIGQTLIVFQDNSIYVDRIALDEDIKSAKYVVYSGRKYEIAPKVFAPSPILPSEIAELIANSEYNIYLKEVTLD
jgi:hypothetical protein